MPYACDRFGSMRKANRASEALIGQLETHVEPEPSLKGEICQCVSGLLDTLKPQYRQALTRIDLEEGSWADLGEEAGITANNAAVRVHRARKALRSQVALACGACATHGCLDCESARLRRTEPLPRVTSSDSDVTELALIANSFTEAMILKLIVSRK
jgi:hypothetical protein